MSERVAPRAGADALDRLLDALEADEPIERTSVRDGLAALVDRVGESTVHLLDMIDQGAPLTVARSHPAVADVIALCGLDRPPADEPVEVPVTIGPRPAPRCEVCGGERPEHHAHVADVDDRRLLCVCDACRLLLEGQERGRLRALPADTTRHVMAAPTAPHWWEALDLPVGLVFLLCTGSDEELVAAYPGPAGVIESDRPVAEVPDELRPAPDTEALVVLASNDRFDAWLTPVTVAYGLAGRLREEHVMGDPMAAVRDVLGELLA